MASTPTISGLHSTSLLSTINGVHSTPLIPTATTVSTSSTLPPSYWDVATQFTLGAAPVICTSSSYSTETKMSVPTGFLMVVPGAAGWGPEGTIWDISTGSGAKLVNMRAECQGSSCTNINGNEESSGTMKERADGSWYLNITAHMQPELSITGHLDDTAGQTSFQKRSKIRSNRPTYPLVVSGVPPCGLPIAYNCTARHYQADYGQWDAYQMDEFMRLYLAENDINDFNTFRTKAMYDFMFTSDAKGTVCDISNPHFRCPPPEHDECSSLPTINETRGWIMTTAIIQYTNFLSLLYSEVEKMEDWIPDEIDAITVNNWVPAATESWNNIVSTTAAVSGILVAAMILLDAVTSFFSEAVDGALIAASVMVQTTLSIAGNVGNLQDPGNTDTEFEQSTNWRIGAKNLIDQIAQGILALDTNRTSQANISQIMGGGNWVSKEVSAAFNTPGWSAQSTNWFGKVMTAQFVTQAIAEVDGYILFIAYGDDVPYNGQTWGFNQSTCEDHWANDPSWQYYVACDIPFGPGGSPGMSLFTRPSSEGSASESWMEKPLDYKGRNITGWDIMGSAIWGQQEFGFNHTFLDHNFLSWLSANITTAADMFRDLALDQPGLFSVPVCVVDDLVYVSGVDQVMSDIQQNLGQGGYYHTDNPCPCADYSYTSPGGVSGKFTDFVSQKVQDSLNDCSVSGDMWSADDMSTTALPNVY